MILAQAAEAATTSAMPAWAQVSLALIGLVGTAIGAWQATAASRAGRRAADAAEDVASRTITNHGRNIGEHVEALGDQLAGVAERQAHGHRIMERAVHDLVEMRAALDEHLATPHAKPRARKAAAPDQPVDLSAVEESLTRKPRPRGRAQG